MKSCTLCIFPIKSHHLPNELNANVFQIQRFCIISALRKSFTIRKLKSQSQHTANYYFDEWQELWTEKSWTFPFFHLFFCINLMKFAAFVRKTVVCHIQWMLKMKKPNRIRYFIEILYYRYWVMLNVQCTTLQQTYYNVHISTGSRWCSSFKSSSILVIEHK